MKAIMAVLIGVMVLLSPAGMGADEPPVEEPVDLSTVHRLALLPVAVKLEPARRPPRANPTILRKESREKPRAEEATDAERLEVAKMAGEVFRQTFADFLRNTGYHLVDLPEVDRRVAAPAPGQELDAVASGRAVGADAVLTLTVTKASNEIGGLYSTTTLSVVMSMVVVSTGQIAWEVEEEETIRSGALPGGSQVVEIVGSFDRSEAAKRRDLRRVAQGLARKLVLTLPDPHRNLDVPVAPPGITTATAVAPKDAEAPLMVQLAGDPAQRASFDLARADGTVVYSDLPMNEKEPGRYVGVFTPLDGDPLGPEVRVRLRLRGENGLCTRRWVSDESGPLTLSLPVSGSPGFSPPAPPPGFRSPSDSKGPKIEFAAGWPPCQPRALAILPFSGKDEGALLLRQTLFAGLLSSQFRLVDNLAVDRTLTRLGKPLTGGYSREDLVAIAEALGADLLMAGDVTKWDRTYMVLQSTISTALAVTLYDGATGAVVARVEDKKSKSRGLAGIPTGIGAAGIAPITGMSKRFLYRSAFDLTESIAGALSCAPGWEDATGSGGGIKSVTCSGADPARLVPGDTIEVKLEAPAGGRAYFSVGEVWSFLPMRETAPGVYVGAYQLRVGDYLSDDPVEVVHVMDGWKRSTRVLTHPTLSTATAGR